MKSTEIRSKITDTDGQLKIQDQLCFALYSVSRAITKQYAIVLEDMGITYPQYLALLILWQKDGLSIQEIADKLELDQATTTPLVQRLEKLEIVSRVRSTVDERRVQVYLTSKGRKLFKKAIDVPDEIGCATGVKPAAAKKLIVEANKIKKFINAAHADQAQ